MGRVIHIRIHGLSPTDRDPLQQRFAEMTALREWRHEMPWLADARSGDLFRQLYFARAADVSRLENPTAGPLDAAAYMQVEDDEFDALALVFILRELSERFGVSVTIRDPENPIAKLRSIALASGRLPDGRPLEAVLVRRPIFKKLANGGRIEFSPPGSTGSAFGHRGSPPGRSWSFIVSGIRASAPNFFEAEAEAMRMYRGLRFLE